MNGHHYNRSHGHGYGHGNYGKGHGGYCTCPQCGYSVRHEAGVPCNTVICPNCNTSLVRSDTQGENNMSNQNKSSEEMKSNPEPNVRKIQYPKVVAEKCTGCQQCISFCPRDAIVLKDGKAFVETENCSNCRVCIRVCPEGAITLE